jgi:prepilin-type processing-associated H-X9-DG protein
MAVEKTQTVRSMSMNAWMNPLNTPDSPNNGLSGKGTVYRKQVDITGQISPATCWVTIDENDYSINDAWFDVSPYSVNAGLVNARKFIDIPGAYHNNACGLSFADGHAEIRRWHDPILTRRPPPALNFLSATSPYTDLIWLQQHTSYSPQ